MSTQHITNSFSALDAQPAKVANLVRILSLPTRQNDNWCDFIWQKTDGSIEKRCICIDHKKIDYFGYEFEEVGDDFAPEGIVEARGKTSYFAKEANELSKYELSCIIAHFKDCHEPSEFYVAKRVVGKRTSYTWKQRHNFYWGYHLRKRLKKLKENCAKHTEWLINSPESSYFHVPNIQLAKI